MLKLFVYVALMQQHSLASYDIILRVFVIYLEKLRLFVILYVKNMISFIWYYLL